WSGPRYRYTGQIELPEAGLYDYKARAYAPGLGRFLQTDPAGYSSDLNLYAYAGEDPINQTDPSGMDEYFYTEVCVDLCDSSVNLGAAYDCWGDCNAFNPPAAQSGDIIVTAPSGVEAENSGWVGGYAGGFGGGAASGGGSAEPAGGGGSPNPKQNPKSPNTSPPHPHCSGALGFAKSLNNYGAQAQNVAAVAGGLGLAAQAAGPVVNPGADFATGGLETFAAVAELSSLAAQGTAAVIFAIKGRPGQAVVMMIDFAVTRASGISGPALHVVKAVTDAVGATVNQGPCG
ncbi:MAG: RHS repeat-associated core domain-containing protein, partial [Caulobacteraceae bacterium]